MLKRVRFILWRVLPLAALAVAVAACSSAPAAQPTTAPKTEPTKAAATAPQPTVSQKSEPTKAAPAKTYRFAASIPASDNPWWITVRKVLERKAAENKIELRVAIANEDAAKQLTDVEDLIQSKPDALILGPVDFVASEAAVERAVAAGVPVFAIGRETKSEKIIAGVTAPEEELGAGAAAYVGKLLTSWGGGEVVHLRGAAGASYTNRQEAGFNEEIKKYPAVKVVAHLAGRDNRAEGMKLMEDALQRWPNVQAVVGCNDEVALGALGAIEAAGKPLYPKEPKGIAVTGNTGNPDGIKAIQEGRLAYLGMKGPSLFAEKTFDIAVDYVIKGKRDIPKKQYTEMVGITRENVNNPEIVKIWQEQ